MNNTYNLSVTVRDRKILVKRLEELTGIKANYTYVPRCAYEIGAFTVERDCSLTVGEDADESIIETLLTEEMIVEATPTDEPETDEEDDIDEDADVDDESDTEDGDYVEIDMTIISDTDDLEQIEAPEDTGEDDADAEDADGDDTEEEDPDEYPLDLTLSIPLADHTVQTLKNLICTIYSRGALLSKATGGEFFADKTLTDALDEHEFHSVPELIAFFREWEETNPELKGIRFDDDELIFDGFGEAPDAEHEKAFTDLATAINTMALTQKRVQAKEVDDSNEKYTMRIWLVRIGFGGAEYKTDRKILMENLSGHSAFRNDEEKAKWTERQKAKRDAARAAAQNADTEQDGGEEA